jgi:hypothetical protein
VSQPSSLLIADFIYKPVSSRLQFIEIIHIPEVLRSPVYLGLNKSSLMLSVHPYLLLEEKAMLLSFPAKFLVTIRSEFTRLKTSPSCKIRLICNRQTVSDAVVKSLV